MSVQRALFCLSLQYVYRKVTMCQWLYGFIVQYPLSPDNLVQNRRGNQCSCPYFDDGDFSERNVLVDSGATDGQCIAELIYPKSQLSL